MSYNAVAFLIVISLFFGIVLALGVGRYLGRRNSSDKTEASHIRLTAVETAVFGLMGLLIAFTFSGAASRYELRREQIVNEANAISSAYLRIDLLPVEAQPGLREKFRRYLEARISVYRLLPDIEASSKQVAIATSLQQDIWAGTIAALRESPPQVTLLMVPALNEMSNLTTERAIAALTHTPMAILFMLVILGSACSLLAGYAMASMGHRQVIVHTITFAFILTTTVYVILDLDFPRFGLIQLDFADQALLDLQVRMK